MSDNDEEFSDYDPEDDSDDEYDETSSDGDESDDGSVDIQFEPVKNTKVPIRMVYIHRKNLDTRTTMTIYEYAQLVGVMSQIISETGKCQIDNAQGLTPIESAKEHIRQKKAWFYIRRPVRVLSSTEIEVEMIHANDMSLPLNIG